MSGSAAPGPLVVVVGAGPGDPDLLTARAVEVVRGAALVVAPPALRALAVAVAAPGTAVRSEPPPTWPATGHSVWLAPGRGADAGIVASLAAGGARVDVVPGLDEDAAAHVDGLLPDLDAARPLRGWRVVVTRAAEQAGELSTRLRRLGAEAVELPTIVVEGPADGGEALRTALGGLAPGDWLVVTSANGARRVLDLVPDGRVLQGVRLAAIGPATDAVLRAAHLPADLVPERFVAEALLEVFPAPPEPARGRVVLARAAVARDVLPEGLAARGWRVEVVEAYRTVAAAPSPEALEAVEGAEAICFTAPSTFERFVELAGRDRVPPVVACIGPVTAAAVRAAGVAPTVEASVHTVGGLVDALATWARAQRVR